MVSSVTYAAASKSNAEFAVQSGNQARIALLGFSGMSLDALYAQDRDISFGNALAGFNAKTCAAQEESLEKQRDDSINGFSTLG